MMPLDSVVVGEQTREFTHKVDRRWLMAYAAGIGDNSPGFVDSAAAEVAAHPVFPVCLEWPAIVSSRELPGYDSLTTAEVARGVHAAHDLQLFKPIRPGETYTTRLRVVSLRQIRPGAAQTSLIETHDSAGELVCRTWQLTISRDVAVTGGERVLAKAPETPRLAVLPNAEQVRYPISVPEGLGNIYTETARIYNPIHSDRRVALAAGLPDVILHGTATLALSISELLKHELGSVPVTRLGGRFTGMVLMPSKIDVIVTGRAHGQLQFSVVDAAGDAIFSDGFLLHAGG